jgi:hypothetical protein
VVDPLSRRSDGREARKRESRHCAATDDQRARSIDKNLAGLAGGPRSDVTNDPNICTRCIGAKRFAKWIGRHGVVGQCGIEPAHGRRRKVVLVSKFAEAVDAWFRETFTQGTAEPHITDDSDNVSCEQRGEPYRYLLTGELECSVHAIDVIAEHLPDVSNRDIKQGADPFYDDGQNYEEIEAIKRREQEESEEHWYEVRFRLQWQDFCHNVQYKRRFFQLKELLDDLFGEPSEYDGGIIRPVYMLPIGQKIYRARLLDDHLTDDRLRSDPAAELGAPPRERTRAGRMNVEYIPAFYAAFSRDTAVAEIRPGIGEQVGIGEFTLQRELKTFDFTDADTRYDFIDQMEGEISKPILAFDRQREYIPTQIVAEYLREYFGCDAVIYRSSMIKDRNQESRNIVLLNKGDPFVGVPAAPLAFTSFTVEEVADVVYRLADARPF